MLREKPGFCSKEKVEKVLPEGRVRKYVQGFKGTQGRITRGREEVARRTGLARTRLSEG